MYFADFDGFKKPETLHWNADGEQEKIGQEH